MENTLINPVFEQAFKNAFWQTLEPEVRNMFRQELQIFFATHNQNTPIPDELLTVQEAAIFLNLAVATIYAMVQRKELPVSKRGGRLYFSKAELLEYVKAGRKKTAAEIETEAKAYVGTKNRKG